MIVQENRALIGEPPHNVHWCGAGCNSLMTQADQQGTEVSASSRM